MAKTRLETINSDYRALVSKLEQLQQHASVGYHVRLKWLPGEVKYNNGKQLAEEVVGDTIFVYSENPKEAIELVSHGFAEWLLNQNTRPYRQLVNLLITLFEQQQYEKKEKIIEALAKLMTPVSGQTETRTKTRR